MDHTDEDLPPWWPTDKCGNPFSLSDDEEEVYRKMYESDDAPEDVVAHLRERCIGDGGGGDDEGGCPICGQPYAHKRVEEKTGLMKKGVSLRNDAEVCKGAEGVDGEREVFVHLPDDGDSSGDEFERGSVPFRRQAPFSSGSDSSDEGTVFLNIRGPGGSEEESDDDDVVDDSIEQAFRDGDDVAVVYKCGTVKGFDSILQHLADNRPHPVAPASPEIASKCPDSECSAHIDRVEYRESWV